MVLIIPKDTILTSSISNINFLVTQDVIIPANNNNVYGRAGQYSRIIGDILGDTNGDPAQRVPIPDDYVHNSMSVSIDSLPYTLFNSPGLMNSTSYGFTINIDVDGVAYMEFGDGINGRIPPTGMPIYCNYLTSLGSLGNLPPNSIDTLSSSITGIPVGTTLVITNPDYSSGGTDFEGIETIRRNGPRSLRTLYRAVTYQDYKDLALLVPGVGNAEVRFCCGKFVDIYIIPHTRGIATLVLLDAVKMFMECKKMITTHISVQPAGLTKIWLKAKIYGKPLQNSTDIYNQVVNALDLEFGFPKIEINRKIAMSDIIAIVDGLTTVDRIDIEQVRVLPYARPLETTQNPLNIEFLVLPNSNQRRVYTILYNHTTSNFEIYKDAFFILSLPDSTPFNDGGNIAFKINPGTYSPGDRWEFVAFPSYPEIFPTTLFDINDYSAPIIDVGPLVSNNTPRTIFSEIDIITQTSNISCLPPC